MHTSTRRCVHLLKQWNHIWHSSYHWRHHLVIAGIYNSLLLLPILYSLGLQQVPLLLTVLYLVKLMTIHCHSSRSICLLHRPNRRIELGCGGNHHSCFFQVFDGGTNPPRMQYCFWFAILLGKGSFNGFYLAFPTIMVLTPQVRKPMWAFCHLLSMSILIMHFRTRKITTGWVRGPNGSTVRQTWAKILLIAWPL